MSTAVGHGLADPKTRGKPVSHANEGRRTLFGECGNGEGQPELLTYSSGRGKTHAAPVPKGIPVKIPEPEGWTECHSRCSLSFCWMLARASGESLEGVGFKGHSHGGNAKPTFGILFVNPGRDLFSS